MKLLAIDPGITSGFCLLDPEDIGLSWWQRTTPSAVSMFEELESVVDEGLTVVCEDYRIYPSKVRAHIGSQVHVAKVIGAIEVWASIHDYPLTLLPAAAKGYLPLAKIKKKYPVLLSLSIHARDAAILGLVYLSQRKVIKL